MISKHISDKEGVYSRTALRLGIKNKPTKQQLNNMVKLAEEVFEPLREYANGPIKINSFFRSPDLNKAIGGSTKSQHCKGQAVDLECLKESNADVAMWIENNLDFDQLILEFYTPGDPRSGWIHISYNEDGKNRKSVLTASRINGKTVYTNGLNI